MKTVGKQSLWKGVVGALTAFGGIFVFAGLPLRAAPAADLTVTVSITDTFPPAAVTDLAAAGTITPGEVLLTWTAPDEDASIPSGQTVQSYIVKHATFSVDSLGGDTTLWWSLATTAPTPPVPQSPGNAEFGTITSLSSGQHWFAVRSQDDNGNLSPIDVNAATPGLQANVTLSTTEPAAVAGFSVTETAPGQYQITWPPVLTNTEGDPETIAGYRLYRSTDLFGGFTGPPVASTGTATLVFDVTADLANEYFYVVRAVSVSGQESPLPLSNFLHVTTSELLGQLGRANDGTFSRSFVPVSALPQLTNGSDTYLLSVSSNTDPAYNKDTQRTLATYTVALTNATGSPAPAGFTLNDPVLNVTLQYENLAAAPPSDPNQLGVLWWNGTAWVKVGRAQVNGLLRTVSFETGAAGVYQVRRFNAATELTLDRAAVFPRIFSPNGDGFNDMVYFVVENPNASALDGRVFDISNAEVGRLSPAGAGAPTPDSLVWDGRDKSGNIVPAGVYIYQIKGEGKTFSGTIVVAK